MRRYPVEICDQCTQAAPDDWRADLMVFCPHHRTIAWRGHGSHPWNVETGKTLKHSAALFATFEQTAQAHCKKFGITREQFDAQMQTIRTMGWWSPARPAQ